jgi:hypothetical protein
MELHSCFQLKIRALTARFKFTSGCARNPAQLVLARTVEEAFVTLARRASAEGDRYFLH